MLKLERNDVVKALINRKFFVANSENVDSPLNLEQAYYVRDALAKDIYERTFNWILKIINLSLEVLKN
jgi:myosin-1